MPLDQATVKELFNYHSDGYLIKKIKYPRKRVKRMNTPAGSWHHMTGGKRHGIRIKGKWHFVHRLIFLYHHGWCPVSVDHIDRDKHNNRIENLRPATSQQQAANKAPLKKAAFKGIHKSRTKWRARITIDSRKINLGSFKSPENAAIAYNFAAAKFFGVYAYLNKVEQK